MRSGIARSLALESPRGGGVPGLRFEGVPGVPWGRSWGLATHGTTQDARKAAPLLGLRQIKNPSAYLVGVLPGQSWGDLGGWPGAWPCAFSCVGFWCGVLFFSYHHNI